MVPIETQPVSSCACTCMHTHARCTHYVNYSISLSVLKTWVRPRSPIVIPYSRKIWRGIKFGGLAVAGKTSKLKSAKIYTSCMSVWRYCSRPPNLNPPILFNTQFGGQTAKFNDCQYFGYTVYRAV